MNISYVLTLLTIHFVADFMLQSDWMATNKSKRMNALLLHTGIYAACFVPLGWSFWFITLIAHTATDFVTSRITSKLWQQKQTHWFFVVIGLDQLLHFYQLILTAWWLNK